MLSMGVLSPLIICFIMFLELTLIDGSAGLPDVIAVWALYVEYSLHIHMCIFSLKTSVVDIIYGIGTLDIDGFLRANKFPKAPAKGGFPRKFCEV